jgi:GDPmannose 4,6-dehydratase
MWRIMQHSTPDDYVLATGKAHSIVDFLNAAFGSVGLTWADYLRVDSRYLRPSEAQHLMGGPAYTRDALIWKPTTTFKELVRTYPKTGITH